MTERARLTATERLLAFMLPGRWYRWNELRDVGGTRFAARLNESGVSYESDEDPADPKGPHRYRLTGSSPSEPQASPRLPPSAGGATSPPPPEASYGGAPPQHEAPPAPLLPPVPELPSPWDAVFAGRAFAGADVRHTTSSRRPGVDVVGTVRRARRQLERCPSCGALAYPLNGAPHAPRHVGGGLQVNCVGQEVRR